MSDRREMAAAFSRHRGACRVCDEWAASRLVQLVTWAAFAPMSDNEPPTPTHNPCATGLRLYLLAHDAAEAAESSARN